MAKITWDESVNRLYETGVDHVSLFIMNSDNTYGSAIPWNGVTGITESPDGADANDIYADNMKYLSLISKENWKGTIKAYTSPNEFKQCEGEIEYNNGTIDGIFFGQQARKRFALAWRTIVGNAAEGDAYGYKYHIAYGLSAAPSERDHATENDSPEATEFSWELSSIPEVATEELYSGFTPAPVSHVVVESKNNTNVYNAIENAVTNNAASLPGLDALIRLIKTTSN